MPSPHSCNIKGREPGPTSLVAIGPGVEATFCLQMISLLYVLYEGGGEGREGGREGLRREGIYGGREGGGRDIWREGGIRD